MNKKELLKRNEDLEKELQITKAKAKSVLEELGLLKEVLSTIKEMEKEEQKEFKAVMLSDCHTIGELSPNNNPTITSVRNANLDIEAKCCLLDTILVNEPPVTDALSNTPLAVITYEEWFNKLSRENFKPKYSVKDNVKDLLDGLSFDDIKSYFSDALEKRYADNVNKDMAYYNSVLKDKLDEIYKTPKKVK